MSRNSTLLIVAIFSLFFLSQVQLTANRMRYPDRPNASLNSSTHWAGYWFSHAINIIPSKEFFVLKSHRKISIQLRKLH